jgi:hypothetical protein
MAGQIHWHHYDDDDDVMMMPLARALALVLLVVLRVVRARNFGPPRPEDQRSAAARNSGPPEPSPSRSGPGRVGESTAATMTRLGELRVKLTARPVSDIRVSLTVGCQWIQVTGSLAGPSPILTEAGSVPGGQARDRIQVSPSSLTGDRHGSRNRFQASMTAAAGRGVMVRRRSLWRPGPGPAAGGRGRRGTQPAAATVTVTLPPPRPRRPGVGPVTVTVTVTAIRDCRGDRRRPGRRASDPSQWSP